MYEELKGHGFTVITVALDQSPEDPRPWIEAAAATHPSLIDTEHVVAERYGIVNVPTVVWIDETGTIVRPHDVAFGSDMFTAMTGIDPAPHLEALRRWVTTGDLPIDREGARAKVMAPTAEEQLAKTEFTVGWCLHKRGRIEAAQRHFERAGELSPFDFTVRRAALPIIGKDPMGPDFADMFSEWIAAGRPYYRER